MLNRCRARADDLGLEVVLHHSPIETMELGRRFRSIYLAGPTFNLLIDDATALRALERIGDHLEPDGAALIPLFVPEAPAAHQLGRPKEIQTSDGTIRRCTVVDVERNESARCQSSTLRYEQITDSVAKVLERQWILHWYSQAGFRDLCAEARLAVRVVLDSDGHRASEHDDNVVFIVERG
jgi:hypothetical protein